MIFLLFLQLCLAAPASPEGAQSVAEVMAPLGDEAMIPGLPPGPAPSPEAAVDLALRTGKQLRCPVCQGLSVADSTSEAAVAMQRRVEELVAAGYSEDQVLDFFVARYGDFIRLDPPATGLNWLIWLGPGLGAGLGLAWATSTVVAWRDEEEDGTGSASGDALGRDPFERRLLAELETDGDT